MEANSQDKYRQWCTSQIIQFTSHDRAKKKRTGTLSNVMTIVTLPVSCSMTDLEHKLLLEYALE